MTNQAKLLTLLGVALASGSASAAPGDCQPVGLGSHLCEARNDFRIKDYCQGQGSPTAVLLSATWCTPCQEIWDYLRPRYNNLDWVKLDVSQAAVASPPNPDLVAIQATFGDLKLPVLRLFSADCSSFETEMRYEPIVELVEAEFATPAVAAIEAGAGLEGSQWRNELPFGLGSAAAFGLGMWFHVQAENAADRGRRLRSDETSRLGSLNREIRYNNIGVAASIATGTALLGWLVYDNWSSR